MTREEAIKLLKQYQGYEPMSPDGETLKHAFDLTDETVDALLTALRPVSREQVEKVLRGEWGRYCFSDDSHGYQCKNCGVQLDDPVYYRSFCPKCGKAMTDEAVQMVMERLEELHDTSN